MYDGEGFLLATLLPHWHITPATTAGRRPVRCRLLREPIALVKGLHANLGGALHISPLEIVLDHLVHLQYWQSEADLLGARCAN